MPQSNLNIVREPDEFLQTIKALVTKVVSRYIARGVIPRREQKDVETSIIEKFLLKQDKINSAFQGKAKVTTYYIAVLNRMCAEVIRKEQKHWYAINDDEDNGLPQNATVSFDTAKSTLVQEELKRFHSSLMLFNGTADKFLLFLKYYYDIPLQEVEIANYAGSKKEEAKQILAERGNLSKAMVNERLAELVSVVEGKDVGGDAVRMWINKHLNTLLNRLNGKNRSFHDKETIGLMLEMQYSSK